MLSKELCIPRQLSIEPYLVKHPVADDLCSISNLLASKKKFPLDIIALKVAFTVSISFEGK